MLDGEEVPDGEEELDGGGIEMGSATDAAL